MARPESSCYFYKAPIMLTLAHTFQVIWVAVHLTLQAYGLCHCLSTFPVSQQMQALLSLLELLEVLCRRALYPCNMP